MISAIFCGERTSFFEGSVGKDGEVLLSVRGTYQEGRRWPFSFGWRGRLESFATYDSMRIAIQDIVMDELNRINREASDRETKADLDRFVEEIS